ncbi:MAG: hypothetical protein CMF41_03380 [Legionellales bacterium]|nr:hypothetical protein [Legionellales bacterium]OUX65328.1 MAG: hypothetical protein CBE41_01795 [Gammaproteobacteria bacterium TMED281]|tara:strand:+ start:634 stop:1311 length:678 start_codon:yes stop_codon:yes gene_type:complete
MRDWMNWLLRNEGQERIKTYGIGSDADGLFWCFDGHKQRVDWIKKYRHILDNGLDRKAFKLLRAIWGKSNQCPSVLDACAGLGKDAYLIALSGCSVTACEKSALVYGFLQNAIDRLDSSERVLLTCVHADVMSYMKKWPVTRKRPDVVYLDPMFNHRLNAKVKQHAWFLREIGEHGTQAELLEASLSFALSRVVVKRSVKNTWLQNKKPTYSIEGKTTRFDIYQV